MEIHTPEHHGTPERSHRGCLQYEEDGASKHHRHCTEEGGTEKHRSSDDKHKRMDDLEGRSSKHKHKHHKHNHRRKRQKDNEGSADEISSDRGDFGLGGHTDGDCRTGDALTADADIYNPRIEHSGEDFIRKNSFMVREDNGEIVRAGGVVDTSEVAYTEEAQQSLEDLKTKLPDMAGINSLDALDDEKEEGEILDEEDITHIIAESDTESGEIKTGEVSGLQDAGVDDISSNVFLAKEVQSLQSTEFFNLKLSMRLVNHKALFVEDHVTSHTKGEHGKASCSSTPALQSMLGISEAYDSEHGSADDSRVDGRMTADLESHLDEVRGRVEAAQPCRYNKLIRAGFDVTADIMFKSKKMYTHDSAAGSEGDSLPPLGKLHCGGSQSQEKGVGEDNLKRELRKSRRNQSVSPDSRAGKRQRLRSRSQEGDMTMDGKQKAGTSISPSKVFLGSASEIISHYPVLQGSDSLDDAVNKAQRRKRSRSLESTEELLARRPLSSLLEREIDEHCHKGNTLFHSTKTLPEQLHADSGHLRSRESGHEGKEHRTTHGCNHSRDGRPRDVESGATCHSRRSRSREHVVYQRRCNESRERVDMTESKELAHDNKYNRDTYGRSECGRRSRSREAVDDYRLARDSPNKSLRGRRSRSRETGHDYRDMHERSERRRSRSKQTVHDSKYSKDSAGRSEQARRSRSRESGCYSKYIKDRSERYEHGRRSMSREGAHDSRYAKDSQERTERGRRSRSREALHDSRHAMEEGEQSKKSRSREAADDSRDNRDSRARYEQRRSRSREGGRFRALEQEYVDRRRRSISRIGTDSLDRRRRSRSRSRESVRDHRHYVDRRRHSRSKELARDQRMINHDSHGNGRHAIGEEHNRLTETSQEAVRDKTNDKSFKDLNMNLRDEEDQADYQESVTLQSEDEDVERIKEERRIRRRAILEKYNKQQQSNNELRKFTVIKDLDLYVGLDANLGASDSTRDTRRLLDENASVVSNDLRKDALQNRFLDRPSGIRGLGEGTLKNENSNDMFCDYIFGDSPAAGGQKLAKGDGLALETSGLTDNWDDADGYYCYRIGEILDGRYEVAASHGRGVFSSVVRARDLKATQKESEEVAIKIIRNNEVMFKSGQQEHAILKKLAGADPENRRHCVLFLSCFEYRNHLCLVFESLHMNLREILKKFGRNIGISLKAVRAYAKQLFIALKHLRNCGVLHCDIKPDNMLVNEAKNVLKLCDFGSAMFSGENEITPYLVSRFYRAPEIILGLPYDHPLDMWSVGCCLYEFFTGKVLFPGPTNNDMLRLHMEMKGLFPKKMLKKAGFASKHFDQDFNFCAVEEDPVTKTNIKRVLVNVKPKDIGSLVTGQGTADEDLKMLSNFKDLLDKIFMLDPEKRLTVSQALSHPFISGK